jgi:hypothetical protein
MKFIKAGVLDDQEDIEKHGPNVEVWPFAEEARQRLRGTRPTCFGERGAEGWNGSMRTTQGGATRGGLLVFSAFS